MLEKLSPPGALIDDLWYLLGLNEELSTAYSTRLNLLTFEYYIKHSFDVELGLTREFAFHDKYIV